MEQGLHVCWLDPSFVLNMGQGGRFWKGRRALYYSFIKSDHWITQWHLILKHVYTYMDIWNIFMQDIIIQFIYIYIFIYLYKYSRFGIQGTAIISNLTSLHSYFTKWLLYYLWLKLSTPWQLFFKWLYLFNGCSLNIKSTAFIKL